jgi:hypothetical protein
MSMQNHVESNSEIYGSGGSEINLSMAAYRYFRHKYNNSDGLDGSWLMHEAFSIRKWIDNVDITNKEKYALFTAFFQSGKTFLAIDLVIIYLSFNMTPVIVVPKSADVRQLLSRMKREMSEFVSAMLEQGFPTNQLEIYSEILYHSSEEKMDDVSKFEKAISRESNRCIVCIKHYQHIIRLLDIDPDSNIVLFIDEAHTAGGYKQINEDGDKLHDEDVKYDCAIAQLKAEAKKVILQTATSANIMISEHELWSDCIYQKNPGSWYRGPTQIEYQTIGTKDSEEELIKALLQLSREKPRERVLYRDNCRVDFHPIYMLAHTTRSVDQMKNILKSFHDGSGIVPQEVIDANWLVMTFQGEGLRVWHKTFVNKTIIIEGIVSINQGAGEHLFPGIEPEQMMIWCGGNGGVDLFPRIVILSYDMGEEGITFGTHVAPYWHLTHLLMFGNTTSARTAQIVNRLSGNHGDNHPLIAMVSNCNKCKSIKEFLAHDEWVKDLCSIKQKGNFQIANYLITKKHLQGHIPNKFISINGARDVLESSPNPNLREENKAMRKSHAAEICIAFDQEKFKRDYNQMIDEKKESHRLSEILDTTDNLYAMGKAYERPNSKIRMIIDLFIAEDYRGLTIEEIRESNYGLNKINITNYDRWEGGRSAKYKILEKNQRTGRYSLRLEIIEYLNYA